MNTSTSYGVVFLGDACNNHCIFCSQASNSASRPEAPPPLEISSDLDDALDRAQSLGLEGLWLVGGEATLRGDLPELVQKISDRGLRPALQTNGRRLAYSNYLDQLLAAGLQQVEVSLCGISSASVAHHSRSPDAFGQVQMALKNLLASKVETALSLLLTRSNFRELPQFVSLGIRTEASALRVTFPAAYGDARRNYSQIAPRLGLLRPWLQRAQRMLPDGGGLTLVASGLPSCALPDHMAPLVEKPELNLRPGALGPRIQPGVTNAGEIEVCSACPSKLQCHGLDTKYLELYGTSELHPRKEAAHPATSNLIAMPPHPGDSS